MMPNFPKRRRLDFEQPIQDPDLGGVLVPTAEEKEDPFIFSLNFFSSTPPLYPSSSSSSSSILILGTPEKEDGPATGMLSTSQGPPQSPQRASSIPCSKLDGESGNEELVESSSTSESSADTESSTDDFLGGKVTELVHALILKYQLKEAVTKKEMLHTVTREYKNWLPMIFKKASSCLEIFFGIDVREMDSISNTYVLVNSLDLTYDPVLGNDQNTPTNGFLIMILGVILIQGNRASEDKIMEFLGMIGVYGGKEHFIYGEPTKLIKELVQENYLGCRWIPNSDPPRYEFLWGPRAKAETTKMKVLQFVAKIKGADPSFFIESYKEALREEEERAQARIGSIDSTTDSFLAHYCPVASPDPEEG